MILLVSHPGDAHLGPVREALRRRGARVELLDTGRLPFPGRLALEPGRPGGRLLVRTGRRALDLAAASAVWWRRPRALAADPRILHPGHRGFAVGETAAALAGLWALLPARLVNPPAAEEAAGRKVAQLGAAAAAGLAVPRTLVTSDPGAARAFLASAGPDGAVVKGLTADASTWRETRRVGPAERRLLPLLRLAPVLLQARVPGVDVRVTAVGRRLFAAEIDARGTAGEGDFRLAFAAARVRPLRLPASVARPLRRLLGGLGLAYAAVDLRRTEAGAWHFLEVNPSGQWRFVEERTGQPITSALAGLLAGDEG